MNKLRYALMQYPFTTPKIKELECEILAIIRFQNEARDTLRASIWFDMPRPPHAPSNPVLSAVINILDTFALQLAQIETDLNELYINKKTVEKFLADLRPEERQIVELTFFNNKKAREVARLMHFSLPTVYAILQRTVR